MDLVLRPAMGADGVVWSTVDPATILNTSCQMLVDIGEGQFEVPADEASHERERRLFELEWLDVDPHSWADLLRRGVAAAALRRAHDPGEVERFRELIAPSGVHDELRVVCSVDGEVWATAICYRLEARPFTEADEQLAASWAPIVARHVRRAMLRVVSDASWLPEPPGVVELDSSGEIVGWSAAAGSLLGDPGSDGTRTVLRSLASGGAHGAARSVLVDDGGRLLRLHASPVLLDGAPTGTISVVVERPVRAQLAPLIVRSLGLTARERDVAELTLAGYARAQIAAKLGITADTLGDHLGAVYRKAGVVSRAELCERIYGTYYEEPRSRHVLPSPYGHYLPDT